MPESRPRPLTPARRWLRIAAFAGAAAVLCGATAASQAAQIASVDGAAAISFLNQQRTANGIPAIASVRQTFASGWCPNEDAGPWAAGEMARDWSSQTGWASDASPWDDAPMHQFFMYDPLFTAAGEVNNGGACMGLGDPTPQPPKPTFYAFLADGGPHAVPSEETVTGEGPFAPQDAVGVPEGTPTGPQPLLYALGFPGEQLNPADAVRATSWSLKTRAGARVRNVRMADETAVARYGYPGYMAVGGVMVPPPLRPSTTYVGRVRWRGPNGTTATQTFTFTTVPAAASGSPVPGSA